MKKIPFILFFLFGSFLLYSEANAQSGWKWGVSSMPMYNMGFDAWGAVIDDSGNVLVTGFNGVSITGGGIANYIVYAPDTVFNFNANNQQILVKTDSNGHIKWAKGSQFADTWPLGVVTDKVGNVFVFGTYFDSSLCSFGTDTLWNPSFNYMYYLVKYSAGGNVLWAKNVVGCSSSNVEIGSIGIDSIGNVYVTGGFDHPTVTIGGFTLTNTSTSGDTFDVFIAKYDPSGNVLATTDFGGHLVDIPNIITVSGAGNIYVTGTYFSRSMAIGGTILTDSFMTGIYPASTTFIAKFTNTLVPVWAKGMNSKLTINALTLDGLENIYLTGYMDSSIIWGTDTLHDYGIDNMVIGKYDSSGNIKWVNCAGGSVMDMGWSVSVDNCNNLWITMGSTGQHYGYCCYTVNFDGHVVSTPFDSYDPSFVVKYSCDSGHYISNIALLSGGDDYSFVMADKKGSFYLAGDYYNSPYPLVFGPDSLISFMTDEEELFIAKYNYDSAGCYSGTGDTVSLLTKSPTASPFQITIFPNPASDECNIHCNTLFPANAHAELYDLTGRLAGAYQLSGNNTIISLKGFAPGLYQCRITSGNEIINRKVVVLR